MYLSFYGLKDKPFSIVPNPGRMYMTDKHKSALLHMEYGLRENVGFVLFTGEIGTGKTTIIKRLIKQNIPDAEVAVIFNTNVAPDELIRVILQEFEVEELGVTKSQSLDLLNAKLIDLYARHKRGVLIVDEAQNLSREALEEVRLLSNLQTDENSLLQIVLVGQPELRAKVEHPSLVQLAQRVAVSYHLQPLTKEETHAYVRFRLDTSGADGREIFTSEAVDCIFEASGGIPRAINLICDAALVYGYADDAKTITAEIVDLVLAERGGALGVVRNVEDMSSEFALAADSRSVADANVHERLAVLEASLGELKEQLGQQGERLDGLLQAERDKVVEIMRAQLDDERSHSRKLMRSLLRLRHEIRDLKESYDRLRRRYQVLLGFDGQGTADSEAASPVDLVNVMTDLKKDA